MRKFAPPHEESRLVSWFDKKQGATATASAQSPAGPRVPRHSGSWAALRKRLQAEPGLRIIDVGYTSPNNINYLTDLGHSVFLSDLVHDACMEDWQTGSDEDGNPIRNVEGFLKQSLDFAGRLFDVVLLWTALDYLPEAFVAPVVVHLHSAMNPGGQVTATDNVEVQLAHPYPIQRAFTNRSIERLFAGWSGHKQFLAKDSVSEVIMTR
jgi:2-polyprenyl-3-methyl-5-hydroxy-6-metoxy-1,4-benzoquinol methylase